MSTLNETQCYLVVAIIDKEERLESVLKALARRGHGATFVNSLGMGRLKEEIGPTVPIVEALGRLFERRHALNVTLMSVVQGENAVWDVIGAIEGEIGDLSNPNTGLAFAVPISHLTGYIRYTPEELGQKIGE